jgi:hypothetical protein
MRVCVKNFILDVRWLEHEFICRDNIYFIIGFRRDELDLTFNSNNVQKEFAVSWNFTFIIRERSNYTGVTFE